MTDFNDIANRLAAVEDALDNLPLDSLPLAALQRKLENDWQPDASVLLQPHSITADQLAGGVIPQTVDSGWIAVNNTTNTNYGWAHGLALAVADLHKWELRGWFSLTNPPPAAGIHPLAFRGMKVDNPMTTAQGYENPAWVRLGPTYVEYGIYAPMPVFTWYDPSAGGWNNSNNGYYRFLLRRDPTL